VTPISKTQIDQLGERLRKENISEDDLRQLDVYRESFADAYEEVVASIRSATRLEPVGRWKTNISIIAKLLRERTMRLGRMQDIAGCRVVVDGILVQDSVVQQLVSAFPTAKVQDRRKKPSYGYRAVHLIATARHKLVEIQVRTELQHLWAQQSELLADRIDPAIKYGGGDPSLQYILSFTGDTVSYLEAAEVYPAKQGISDSKARLRQALIGLNEMFGRQPPRVN
jgi:ppGpp synthetase/RelA/SpoT-type nucleotidyltranferase